MTLCAEFLVLRFVTPLGNAVVHNPRQLRNPSGPSTLDHQASSPAHSQSTSWTLPIRSQKHFLRYTYTHPYHCIPHSIIDPNFCTPNFCTPNFCTPNFCTPNFCTAHLHKRARIIVAQQVPQPQPPQSVATASVSRWIDVDDLQVEALVDQLLQRHRQGRRPGRQGLAARQWWAGRVLLGTRPASRCGCWPATNCALPGWWG